MLCRRAFFSCILRKLDFTKRINPSQFGVFTPAKLVAFDYENEVDLKIGNIILFIYFILIFDGSPCHFIGITETNFSLTCAFYNI